MSKRTTRLRRLLADPKILVAPGAYDGIGAANQCPRLLGPLATQMADRVAALTDIVDLPLIADGDTRLW